MTTAKTESARRLHSLLLIKKNLALVDQLASSRLQELSVIEAKLESISKSAHELLLALEELAELIRNEKDNVMVTMTKVHPPSTTQLYVFSYSLHAVVT